jgi:molybdopterin synthase sulfur carrier subunit
MQVHVSIYGQLTDATGSNSLVLNDISDTDTLLKLLNKQYPALREYSYIIAVDKEIISSNTSLADHCTVALLPPYAGG